jgi:hypothetical protein
MIEVLDQRGDTAANLSTQDLRAFAQYESVIGTDEEQPDPFAIFRRPQEPF